MTSRKCPWCGGPNLRRVGSNTVRGTRPGDPYWISVVYWEDRDCGYREVATPDEVYDYDQSKCVDQVPEVLRFHIPRPPLPADQRPDYLRDVKQKRSADKCLQNV